MCRSCLIGSRSRLYCAQAQYTTQSVWSASATSNVLRSKVVSLTGLIHLIEPYK